MRRLAIIDVKGGHQPITTADGRYTIVFNGEIYNYQAIREELIGLGHAFSTKGDTETILAGYARWGADCVHRLRGMFAFAIWDRLRQELFVARAVAERYGTDHHEHLVTTDDLLAELPQIVWYYDQPTPSAFQTYFVSKFTKSQGITVALSGLGGDEIAAGYPYFPHYARQERMWQYLRRVPAPLRRFLTGAFPGSRVGRASFTASQTPGWRYRQHRMLDGIDERLRGLYRPELAARSRAWDTTTLVMNQLDSAPSNSVVNRVIYHDLRRFMLDDPLTDTDRCSMAHSLEVRVPLIDHKLVEFAGTIPPALKIRNGEAKYLLKRLADRYLPREVIYRRKMGFEFPMIHWIRGPLKPLLDSVLSEESVRARGLFRPEAVAAWRRRAEEHPTRGDAQFLWNLTVLELWCRLYLDPGTPVRPSMDTEALLVAKPQVSLAL